MKYHQPSPLERYHDTASNALPTAFDEFNARFTLEKATKTPWAPRMRGCIDLTLFSEDEL